jgi:hypothetical protein
VIDGADVYTFTLTTARIGQIEAVVPPASQEGTASSASIAWVSSQDIPEVRVSGRIPPGSTISQPVDGAGLTSGSDGYSYYSKTFTDVSAGDRLDLTFAYTAPAAAPSSAIPAGASAPSSNNSGAVAAIVLIVVVGVAFFAVAVRRRRLSPATIMLFVVAVVLSGGIFAVTQSSKPPVVDGLLTRTFGGVGACTTASLPLTPAPGVDLAADGGKLIDSLAGVESVGQVTLDVTAPLITVEYCDSSTDEQTIKAALASTGLVSW